jgi:uncharacterized protein
MDLAREIKITAGGVGMIAELNDSETAEAIWDALPVNGRVNTWGDEIYFGIPVVVGAEDAKEVVDLGDIAYWPPGKAFCIFYGTTPASQGDEIRPASPVNVVGKVKGDATAFKTVNSGETIFIDKA